MVLQIEKTDTLKSKLFWRRANMQPSTNCPTCKAEFAGHAQGITFYLCGGKASFGNTGLVYECKAVNKPITINKKENYTNHKCEVCDKLHSVPGNCCIKIQCPCGNQIKTCSS